MSHNNFILYCTCTAAKVFFNNLPILTFSAIQEGKKTQVLSIIRPNLFWQHESEPFTNSGFIHHKFSELFIAEFIILVLVICFEHSLINVWCWTRQSILGSDGLMRESWLLRDSWGTAERQLRDCWETAERQLRDNWETAERQLRDSWETAERQ